MDPFKTQFDRIQKQLSALTPSQRMLTGSLVAIMVMTLVWWGRYAGDPEMEQLLPQAISADDLPNVINTLDAKGIRHAMSGDKLMVPADRRVEAVASLMYAHALPRNAKDGFDAIIQAINPFWSEKQTAQMWNRGKEMTAAQFIREFPDVADCQVMIDPQRDVRIGGGGVEPSATVTIRTNGGAKNPQQLVEAAADVVQGAQSTLSRNRIRIILDGMPRHAKLDATSSVGLGLDSGEQLERIQKAEFFYSEKIRGFFPYIPGLMASVTVRLNTITADEHQIVYDPKVIQKATEEDNRTTESTGAAPGGGEPGVGANTALNVAGGGAGQGGGSTQEENKTKYQNYVGQTDSHRALPGGETPPVGAAVRIPLAYFAGIFEHENPGVKNPTEKQMRALIDEQIPKFRKEVQNLTSIKNDTDVAVETYVDLTPVIAEAGPAHAPLASSLLTAGHIKEFVLGGMALVSLFMVSMMVKKAGPAPILAGAGGAGANMAVMEVGTPILDAGGHLAGQAGESSGMLDGMELDDESVRAQQMLDQVSSLVKENPESAATLIKRWMNK